MKHVILIASMFLLPFKFLMFSHIPLKDCHTSSHCILWHVFPNERRKESLSVPTKSHSKYEKQIRQQIQHEAEWEKSDKGRSKLLGFPHPLILLQDWLDFPCFPWDHLPNLSSPPKTGNLGPLLGTAQERTKKRMRDSGRVLLASTHAFEEENISRDCGH